MNSVQYSRGHVLLHGGFTSGRVDGTLSVYGLDETLARFDRLKMSNPDMEKKVQAIVRKVLFTARKKITERLGLVIGTGYEHSAGDTRAAYKAVRTMVYKSLLGGNINIISSKKAKSRRAELAGSPPRVGRGGNRRPRSANTERMLSYWGQDRSFVLRWINEGTKVRNIRTANNTRTNKRVGRGHTSASLQPFRNGNRGRIAAHPFFKSLSEIELENVMGLLSGLIEDLVTETFGGNEVSYNE